MATLNRIQQDLSELASRIGRLEDKNQATQSKSQQDLGELAVKIARLEERIEPKKGSEGLRNTLLGILGTAFLTWMAWVTVGIASANATAGKALVASLENPKSPAILKANLATVSASIQTAAAQGVKADPRKTIPLSNAVSKVLQNGQPPDEAWQVASQLINYRAADNLSGPLPDCDMRRVISEHPGVKDGPFSQPTGVRIDIVLHNCRFQIDEPTLKKSFVDSSSEFRSVHGIPPDAIYVHYILDHVQIVYSGGEITASSIRFNQCSFEFKTNSQPQRKGRLVIQQLLAAASIDEVVVSNLGSSTTS